MDEKQTFSFSIEDYTTEHQATGDKIRRHQLSLCSQQGASRQWPAAQTISTTEETTNIL